MEIDVCIDGEFIYVYIEKKSECVYWLCFCLGCIRGYYYRLGLRFLGIFCLFGIDVCLF